MTSAHEKIAWGEPIFVNGSHILQMTRQQILTFIFEFQ